MKLPDFNMYNIRFSRDPLDPWEVAQGPLKASVQQIWSQRVDPSGKFNSPFSHEKRIRLSVVLDLPAPWKLLEAKSSQSESVEIMDSENKAVCRDESKKRLEITFVVPKECSSRKIPSEALKLQLRYERQGKVETVVLEIDETCVLGEAWRQFDEDGKRRGFKDFAALAIKFQSDPLIQKLRQRRLGLRDAQGAPLPLASAGEEAGRFADWIHYRYEWDPPQPKGNPLINSFDFYALSPTQTARYGGDCGDISLAAGAYLSSLGIKTFLAPIPGHFTLDVQETSEDRFTQIELVSWPKMTVTDTDPSERPWGREALPSLGNPQLPRAFNVTK